MVIIILIAVVLLAFVLNSKKKPMLTGPDSTYAGPDGKPRLGCLQVVQRVGLFVAACIAVVVIYYSLQPKNVGYDDLLTTDNANTYVDHHTWSDGGFEYGNTEAAERAISHLGDKAYGRKFGDLMDWEKNRHDQAADAQEKARQTSTPAQTQVTSNVADDKHEKRQQIVNDFSAVYKIESIVDRADKALNDAQAGNETDAYQEYASCATDADSLADDEQPFLPDYIKHDEDMNYDYAPRNATKALNSACRNGSTAVNDPTPEHLAALKSATEKAAVSYGVLVTMYKTAYVATGGDASDWVQMFSRLPQ
jgi:hypothetical protein